MIANHSPYSEQGLQALVSDCINIEKLLYQDGTPIICGTLLMESNKAFEIIAERLKPFNLIPILRLSVQKFKSSRVQELNEVAFGDKVELQVRKLPEIKRPKSWLNFLLLAVTICTTILAGSLLAGVNPFAENLSSLDRLNRLITGIPFSFTLLLILGAHELGHYFACKSQGVQATLPYFIPVPPPVFPLGTFGAVIRINSPIKDKKGLLKIGAAGPIVGFIIAIPIVIIGLKLSTLVSLAPGKGHIFLGNSILFWGLAKLFAPLPPSGYDLSLHPVAFAGWVGLFVTAMNLLPVGQLDGGHISYALFGRKSKFIALPFIGIMIMLGVYWQGWLVWALLILVIIGIRHPPPLNDITPLEYSHKTIGFLSLFIFIITFVPIPFQVCI